MCSIRAEREHLPGDTLGCCEGDDHEGGEAQHGGHETDPGDSFGGRAWTKLELDGGEEHFHDAKEGWRTTLHNT